MPSFTINTPHDTEYLRYSNFIGGLLNTGALSGRDAGLMLVEAFWEKEQANAVDADIDLDAQVREYFPNFKRDNVARQAPTSSPRR